MSLVRLLSQVILLVLVAVVAGCSSSMSGRNLLEEKTTSLSANEPGYNAKEQKLNRFLSANSGFAEQDSRSFGGFSRIGSGALTGRGEKGLVEPNYGDEDANVTINLLAANIPQAAKSVLGDVLGLQYTVDPKVSGSITLQTSKPVTKGAALNLFQAALRDNGAALVSSDGSYRIVLATDAQKIPTPLRTAAGQMDQSGTAPELVTLNYISAENMRQVLEPMIPAGMVVRADADRNALILSGTGREIAAIRETISVFDVDWLRGMSFALVPVRSSSPESIVSDLEQIFQTRNGPLKGMVKFVPNSRLRSVLVISGRPKYVREATNWIRKMDVLAETGDVSLHVYHVQNRNAAELAKILDSVTSQDEANQQIASNGNVAPRLASVVTQPVDGGMQPVQGQITGGPETPAGGMDSLPEPQDQTASYGTNDIPSKKMKIVADDSNNSLLIYATAQQFEKIKSVLEQIDTVPNQVLLEAVIAEVSLDDDLRFGVRWFLGEGNNHGTFSDAATGAVSSVFPGFSYFLKSNDIGFTLNALSSVTNVRVLSAPSLVVLDNHTATLQVGDQVPIVTQSAKAVTAGDSPIVTNVELKDTGLILKVVPRVNDSGLVTLDIEQEVSSVVKTTSSGIDSPTIRQRKMKTSVVVNDAEALALGGLIQEKETTGKTKVPVLGDVPLVGAAFRQKTNAVNRTELLIFIRPRVIRDMEEAHMVTEEFRKQLSIEAPRVRRGEPTPGEEIQRIFN